MNRRRIVVTANVVLGVLAGVVLPSQAVQAHHGIQLRVCRADDAAVACTTVKITADVAFQGA